MERTKENDNRFQTIVMFPLTFFGYFVLIHFDPGLLLLSYGIGDMFHFRCDHGEDINQMASVKLKHKKGR